MAYRPPSKQLSEAPSVVHSIDKLLSFRDTWRQPLTSFSFDALVTKKIEAAVAAAEKLNENVAPLIHSEDGFHVIDKAQLSEEERLVRDAQRALNQLTEENFDAVVEPLLQPALFETTVATQVVERIFDKCIEEPKFAPLYARMCLRLSKYEHEFLKGSSSFRKCLITKVQKLFEEEAIPLENKFSDEQMSAARKRKMANTQLVAQLLLCGVLSRKVFAAILESIFVIPHHPLEINVEVGAELIEIVCTAAPDEYQLVAVKKDNLVLNPFQYDKILTLVLPRIKAFANDESSFCKRVQFKLLEICDMANRQWHLRAGAQVQKNKASAGANAENNSPQTPLTAETPGSTVSVGTALFPKSASAIPKSLPKITSVQRKQFVTALSTATLADAAAFQATVKEVSVVLAGSTVTVNRMACLSCFIDSVARLHDTQTHADAMEILASPAFDATEVTVAFLWTVVEGIRESIREDVPKYFDRLAVFFADAALVKRQVPFISLVRDLFVPVTERVHDSIKNAEKEGIDEDMCCEEFVHAWESFLKVCNATAQEKNIARPKFAECADLLSKAPFDGPLREMALDDVMGAFISSDVTSEGEMREWVDANGKNKQAAALVAACSLLC